MQRWALAIPVGCVPTIPVKVKVNNTNLHFPMQLVRSEQVGRDGQDNTIQPAVRLADLPQLCRKNVLHLQCKIALTSAKSSMQREISRAC